VKYYRIKKNADYQKLFKRGKKVFSPYVTLLYFPSSTLNMGVAVSKKHGKAVQRNRIKRLLRAAFNENCGILDKTYSIILLPKVREKYEYKDISKSIAVCFKKVNECEKN